MTITQSTVALLRNVWLVLVLGSQAVRGAGSFYQNLIVNGDANSGNQNSWTQEYGDSCRITSECSSQRMFSGPSNANLFDVKSCRISQMIDVRFASKFIKTGRAHMFVSAFLGADGDDYSNVQVWEYDATNANVNTVTSPNVQNTCTSYSANVLLKPTTVQVKFAYTAQQGGIGLTCDAWGTSFQLWLTKETWTQSATITPPPTPTPTSHWTSTTSLSGQSSTQAHTYSVKSASSTTTFSSSSAVSTSTSATHSRPSNTLSASPSSTASASTTVSPTRSHSRGSLTRSVSPSLSSNISHMSLSESPTTSASSSPSTTSSPTWSSSPTDTNESTISNSQSITAQRSGSMNTASLTGSCGLAPIVTFLTAESANGAFGGGATSVVMSVVDLLFKKYVVLWLSFPSESSSAWSVISRQVPTGVAAGGSVTAFKVSNKTAMPDYVVTQDGDEVWQVVVTAPPGGFLVTSTSMYVTQRFGLYVSVLCVNGGSGALFDYGLGVVAVGAPLPYSPAFQVVSTFSQSMAQIASGTVVPTSLSTMRALSRLASCGTTNSGSDTSYGIVSVLVPLIEPLNLSADAELTALNLLLCFIVAALVLSCAACAYAFLCRSVAFADVIANFHLPSLVAPSVMFAFPTVLGTSIAIFAAVDSPLTASSLTVGLLGTILSASFVAWIIVTTTLFGPHRVVAVRLHSAQIPKFPVAPHLSAVSVMRWVRDAVVLSFHRTYSWKGLKGSDVQGNVRWKHGYHILIQDVRFLLIPVAEALSSTVATVVTALVVVPGVGCQAAICVIAVFYGGQTLLFLWLRPYSSTMMQVFASATNILTLFATIALAIDIFQVERIYSTRMSVSFQLILLGMSAAKGLVDASEFFEGSRRLWVWIMTQHELRMESEAQRGSGQLTVFYREDDAVSDDGFNIMMLSVAEGSPRTPLHTLGLSTTSMRDLQKSSKSSLSNSFSSEPETITRHQNIRPLKKSASFVDDESIDGKSSSAKPTNNSFRGDSIGVDGDAIHRSLQDRLKANQSNAKKVGTPSAALGYTAFMIDQPSEELADVHIGTRHQVASSVNDDDDDDDDPLADLKPPRSDSDDDDL